jgi:hypothetical protein
MALYSVGAIQARRVPPKGALENLEKSLAIFEELNAKTEQVRALTAMGTRDLMVDFHRSLIATKSKPTKTQALRQAALKLMKTPATSHPFYWAGFVLVGDGE